MLRALRARSSAQFWEGVKGNGLVKTYLEVLKMVFEKLAQKAPADMAAEKGGRRLSWREWAGTCPRDPRTGKFRKPVLFNFRCWVGCRLVVLLGSGSWMLAFGVLGFVCLLYPFLT